MKAEQLQLDFAAPVSSAPLRIPSEAHGWLWLKMGSLLEGNPVYEVDEGMTARLMESGGPKEQREEDIWARAEAWHAGKAA